MNAASSYSEFDKAIIEHLISAANHFTIELTNQFKNSHVKSRNITGHGFYTDIFVPLQFAITGFPNFELGCSNTVVSGIENGMTFILFVRNGIIDFLEGATYGEEYSDKCMIISLGS